MKIFKVKSDTTFLYKLAPWLKNNNIQSGDKIGISWKIGKKNKLKSYRVEHNLFSWRIESNDPCISVSLFKNGQTHRMNTGIGLCHMQISSLQ